MFRLSSEGLSAFFLLLVPPGVLATPRATQRATQDRSRTFYTQKNIALKKRSVVKRMFRLSADGLPAFLWVQYNTARAPWGPRQTEGNPARDTRQV